MSRRSIILFVAALVLIAAAIMSVKFDYKNAAEADPDPEVEDPEVKDPEVKDPEVHNAGPKNYAEAAE